MTTDSPSPFQPFIGHWHGLAKDFNAQGQFIDSRPAIFNIFWREVNAIFRIDESGRNQLQIDYVIQGKTAYGEYDGNRGEMVAITPGNYNVTARLTNGHLFYFNHYFFDASTRRILGHEVDPERQTVGYTVYDLVNVAC